MSQFQANRSFMQCPPIKSHSRESDAQKGIPHPPHEHIRTGDFAQLPPFEHLLKPINFLGALTSRRSERGYSGDAISPAQLAFLLWSAHSIQDYRGKDNLATLRTTPSGGARHAFEVYVAVKNVDGLEPGFYHYLPTKNVGEKKVTIERLCPFGEHVENQLTDMLVRQRWASKAPTLLFISCLPYRAEWRYQEAAHRTMLIDLGHIGQNVMLSATALGLGSCPMTAFNQQLCDDTLGFEREKEYTVYVIPVGKLRK
ncbi:MAG: SagB/ThcOx family dehydrogenase [Turicibacter sp.]|nr:SagB/ThcOx family dehydrogenase [Turicibacter sp.]